MKTKIINFFTNSAKVFIIPDKLFNEKIENPDYGGILSLVVYMAILGLVIGILTKSAFITVFIVIASIIGSLISKLIHCFLTYIFAMLFKVDGEFGQLYNLMCYEDTLNILIIIGTGITVLTGKWIIIPLVFLVGIWKMIVTISAVNSVFKFGYGKSFLSAYGLLILVVIILMGLFLWTNMKF